MYKWHSMSMEWWSLETGVPDQGVCECYGLWKWSPRKPTSCLYQQVLLHVIVTLGNTYGSQAWPQLTFVQRFLCMQCL